MKDIMIRRSFIHVDDALEIAAEGFHQPITEGLRKDVYLHLSKGRVVYGVYQDKELVGFVIYNVFDDVLYLSGIILRTHVQAQGIAQRAMDVARDEMPLPYLALRTQSPRMWSAGRKMVTEWYPAMRPDQMNPDMRRIQEYICSQISTAYPVQTGFYGGPLYGMKPTHHDTALQMWWDEICDFERGDAVLCIGRF